jgi:hypothetical protein
MKTNPDDYRDTRERLWEIGFKLKLGVMFTAAVLLLLLIVSWLS